MKRIICLLIAVILMIPAVTGQAAELTWPVMKDSGMPFRPYPNYLEMNNPPCFSWPLVVGATYDLKICTDREMQNVAYERNGLTLNVYNFPNEFETGVRYYWSVRLNKGGQSSAWREPSEFIIDENAYSYTYDAVDEASITAAIKQTHPRLILTDEKLNYLKQQKLSNSVAYTRLKTFADTFMTKHFMTYDEVKAMYERGDKAEIGVNGTTYTNHTVGLANVALMYLITEDSTYLNFVIDKLNVMKDWDPEEFFAWDALSDTTEPIYVEPLGMLYDWLYNYLPDNVRTNTVRLIERHMRRCYHYVQFDGEIVESTLYDLPDRSHQWRMRQVAIAALAVYEDSSLAREIVANIIPIYVNKFPFMHEDGGFDNGPFYFEAGGPIDSDFADCLISAGLTNVKGQAAFKNRGYYLLYQWPVGGFVSILGDNNLQTSRTANLYDSMIQDIVNTKTNTDTLRGVNAWMLKKDGVDKDNYYHSYSIFTNLRNDNEDVEYIAPTMLPQAKYFRDNGVISMFSDVSDDNKIAMIFRSSQHGSLGHMHPDNNSFFIQALGENLAIDSDYYDAFQSVFDLNWNRKTFAHNSVTYDVGEGQPQNDKAAKGKITSFVHHSDFDLASGDATQAYKGGIGKFQRDIIYIRPDTYVVIDDLAAKKGTTSEFEWWINANGAIKLYESGKGLQITKNEAALDVKIAYPASVSAFYNDEFAGPDGVATAPPSSLTIGEDKRVYFLTDKVSSTKMVSYMTVHKVREGQPYVKETAEGNILKLEFEDGTISYIKTDDAETASIDGYTFKGTALTVKGNSIMVVDETRLTRDGILLFEADDPVSCAFGNDEISVSSILSETDMKIYSPDADDLILIRDENTMEIPFNQAKHGVLASTEGDYLNLHLYYGAYSLYMNNKPLPGSPATVNVKLTLDGVTTNVEVPAAINGNQIYAEYLPEGTEEKSYILGETNGLSLKLSNPGTMVTVSENTPLILNKANCSIELTSVVTYRNRGMAEYNDDRNLYADKAISKTRAVDYTTVSGMPRNVFWGIEREVNGYVLQSLNNLNDSVTWTLEVPEDGNYDLVMSYSTLSGNTAQRLIMVGAGGYPLTLNATDDFLDLDSLRLKCNTYMEKGSVNVSVYTTGSGSTIYDWVGLIPSAQ